MLFDIGVSIIATSHFMRNTEDGPVEDCRDIFCVMAQTARGDNFILEGSETANEKEAQAFLSGCSSTPATHPNLWNKGTPSYGTEAWGDEDEYELACFEADCFNEPRPHWF